jgi:hypothetical protein
MILHVLKRSELEGKKGIKIQLISILISAYGEAHPQFLVVFVLLNLSV